MKLIFLGSGAFGLPTLERLARDHELLGIVTQPDRPSGRGRALRPTPVGEWAAQQAPEAPLWKPESVNESGVRERLRGLGADAWVVIAFGQKLSAELLEGVFAVNLHASLLPRWRGAAPIHHAVLAGDAETGNTVITLAERMDAGLILGQTKRPIGRTQTTGDLHDLLAQDGPGLVEEVLRARAQGTLAPVEQDDRRVTHAPKLRARDARLDLTDSADACRRRINGLSPWPGVWAAVGATPVKLLRADSHEEGGREAAGRLIDPGRGLVACGAGALQVLEAQVEGGRPMSWEAFARGRQIDESAMMTTS